MKNFSSANYFVLSVKVVIATSARRAMYKQALKSLLQNLTLPFPASNHEAKGLLSCCFLSYKKLA